MAGTLTGLAIGLLVFAPSAWLAGIVLRASDGRVVLSEPRGTIWSGSAQLLLTGGAGSSDSAALPGRLAWRLRPAWTGIRADIDADCCMRQPLAIRATLRLGGTAVEIADAQTQWPAALLAGLGTPWNTLQVEGELQLATRGLSVEWIEGRLAVAGRAELLAQRMSSRLSTLRPMGSYRMTVSGGTPPTLQLETLDGALRLSGSGSWVGSKLRFSGTASASPEREASLSNLLNIIGRRSGARSIITIG